MRLAGRNMGEVRWAFNIASWKPTAKEWIEANSYILAEEKKRVHQFVFKDDAMLALAGRLLIRSCISHLLGIKNAAIKLGRTAKSKPILVENNTELSFNVSHQGHYSILAASLEFEVGVDVVRIDRPVNTTIPEFFKTMRRQFTADEWDEIKSKPTEWEQMKTFYRLWCLKESYVKAIGTGLGTSTADYMKFELNTEFSTKDDAINDSILFIDGKKVDWIFHECLLDNEHIASVAIKPKDGQRDSPKVVPFTTLSFEELTRDLTRLCKEDPEDWINFSAKKEKPKRNFYYSL